MKKLILAIACIFVVASVQAATFVNKSSKTVWVKWGHAVGCVGTRFSIAANSSVEVAMPSCCQSFILLKDTESIGENDYKWTFSIDPNKSVFEVLPGRDTKTYQPILLLN